MLEMTLHHDLESVTDDAVGEHAHQRNTFNVFPVEHVKVFCCWNKMFLDFQDRNAESYVLPLDCWSPLPYTARLSS